MNSSFVDVHTHLDLVKNFSTTKEFIEKNKIYTICMSNLPEIFEKNEKSINSKYIRVALGMHPELISQFQNQIPIMWELVHKTKYIGEVGLDFNKNSDNILQINFFNELIERCNSLNGKIISIHSRRAEKEVNSILKKNKKNKLMLHWFSGNITELKIALDLNCYFSINYSMVNSLNGQKIINNIPLERILTETDSPFVKFQGKNSDIQDLNLTIEKIAKIKKIDFYIVKNQIFENFRNIIKI